MRVIIHEHRIDQGHRARPIAEWALPDTPEAIELAFTQLATPSTTKVVTYRITIVRDDVT